MEKKVIDVPKYKYCPPIEIGSTKKTVFVASDGIEFTSESGCIKHERDLELYNQYNSIRKFAEYDGIETDGDWFFAQDDEELKIIKDRNKYGKLHFYGDIEPQSWFVIRVQDGGDYEDQIYYTSLKYIKERWNNLLSRLEEK